MSSAGADASSETGIGFADTIAKLDSTASDIVAEQRDALVQRKDLAQKTKDFRKLDDSSKLGEFKGLLKCPCFLTLACMPLLTRNALNSLPGLY